MSRCSPVQRGGPGKPRLPQAWHPLAQLDQKYLWHPFTQMQDWLRHEPIVIVAGQGAVLRDARGREYLDANASIWTNLHGHRHPRIDRALRQQLRKIAHCSALGLANEPASLLGERLVRLAELPAVAGGSPDRRRPSGAGLTRVFFSDDGSTALEVALKLSCEFSRRDRGLRRPRFLSLEGGYHGDTVGAVSVGHIDLFHRAYAPLLFGSDSVMAPYCYRCRFNRAEPARADARHYRECRWECIREFESKLARRRGRGEPYAAVVVEPLMQGAAGMIPQPRGWLSRVAELTRGHGALLVADEVMTGFGRVGAPVPGEGREPTSASLFGCQVEQVLPDFLVLAKGLTGGYLPMAATLTTDAVFAAFLGEYAEFKTFFHGHSYTGNPLGAAAALASLDLLTMAGGVRRRTALGGHLHNALRGLWSLAPVGDIRQVGCVAGIELVRDWKRRTPFPLAERAGIRVAEAMARRGVLTRPIGNVMVLMPPYCATPAQVSQMVTALAEAIEETLVTSS